MYVELRKCHLSSEITLTTDVVYLAMLLGDALEHDCSYRFQFILFPTFVKTLKCRSTKPVVIDFRLFARTNFVQSPNSTLLP